MLTWRCDDGQSIEAEHAKVARYRSEMDQLDAQIKSAQVRRPPRGVDVAAVGDVV